MKTSGRRAARGVVAGAVLGGLALAIAGCAGTGGSGAAGPVGATATSARAGGDAVSKAALRERSLELLLEAASSADPQVRANALEGLSGVPERAEPVVRAALVDGNDGVRAVAAMVAGRARIRGLRAFVEPLTGDASPYVRASAIYAGAALGAAVDRTPLAAMLLESGDPRLSAHAAFLLGESRDRSALPLLRDAARLPQGRSDANAFRAFQIQVAEAMVKLGDEEAIHGIRAALNPSRAEDLELTALAVQVLGRLGDEASAGQLIYLTSYSENGRMMPPEVRLAAADALARLGRREGWFVADGYAADERPLVRALAAIVYGQTRGPENVRRLSGLMEDASEAVRVAAAAAVLEQLGEGGSASAAR